MAGDLIPRASSILKTEGLGALLIKGIRYPVKPLLVPIASRALKVAAGPARTPEDFVNLTATFKSCGISIRPWQLRPEIQALLATVRLHPPHVVVEIGTATGGTLFLLTRVAADDALLVSIDLPGAMFGGGYARWRSPLYRSFARANQRIELLRANSHHQSTVERLRQVLAGKPIDLLFIDGDHSYAGVRQDFESYAPLVAEDGIIAFHDIVSGREEEVGGVPIFWEELKARHDATEFIADRDHGAFGIGIVRLKGTVHGSDRATASEVGAGD
jgi:predicted O-methyltransferase YrrM